MSRTACENSLAKHKEQLPEWIFSMASRLAGKPLPRVPAYEEEDGGELNPLLMCSSWFHLDIDFISPISLPSSAELYWTISWSLLWFIQHQWRKLWYSCSLLAGGYDCELFCCWVCHNTCLQVFLYPAKLIKLHKSINLCNTVKCSTGQ